MISASSTESSELKSSKYQPKLHFPPLDGLRGVAILMVIAVHARISSSTTGFDRGVLTFLCFGQHGVDLFFVLSGFLITGILLDSKESPSYFSTFYIRRTLRIFPLYYLYLSLRILAAPLVASHFHLAPSPLVAPQTHSAFFWLYGSNLLALFHPEAIGGGGLFHLWSLAVEEQFYLFWPLIVFVISKRALPRLCIFLAALALVCRIYYCHVGAEIVAYDVTWCRLDALAIGSVVACAVRGAASYDQLRWFGRILASTSMTCIIGYMVLAQGWETHGSWVTTFGITLATIFSAGILLEVVSGNTWAYRICDVAILRTIGKFSYSMYIFHFAVLRVVATTVSRRFQLPLVAGSHLPQQIFDFVVVSAATLLVATCTWHAYEKWFLRLKDNFRYRSTPEQDRYAVNVGIKAGAIATHALTSESLRRTG